MKRKNSPQLLSAVSILFMGLLIATLVSDSPLAAQPAQSQVVAFQDTYSRDDGAPPENSLGTTEAGPGLAVLDYREIDAPGTGHSVADIAQVEGGKLVVHGRPGTTNPAFVELDDAGPDLDFEVEVEFLITNVDASAAANNVVFAMRNDGALATPSTSLSGMVDLNLLLDGRFGVRGFITDLHSVTTLAEGTVDAAAFATADLDGDGRLETGEPFTLRVILEGDSFSFDFNGSRQISNVDLSSLPDPPSGADWLLFGRNRTWFVSTEVEIRFDNLRSFGESTTTPTPTATATHTGQWQAMSTIGAPAARYGHSAIWTGEEMLVWGGYYHLNNFLNDGGRYDPVTDTWTPISTVNAPIGRLRHTAVWTGQGMIVWGGESGGGGVTTNTGGRYDPATDTWRPISLVSAPSPREMHSAVWTGTEMLVWGGCPTIYCTQVFNDGGRYDPATDTWRPIYASEGLIPRHFHQAVWTGDRMIVWGGANDPQGMSYDPDTGTWTPISTINAPVPTFQGAGIWTGEEMIVWGGCTTFTTTGCPSYVNTGGRYHPATNTWTSITAVGAPAARWTHTAVWTGREMIVWGGCGDACYYTGGRYDPQSDTWIALELTNAPSPRSNHEAVWTGEAMIVWSGCSTGGCVGATTLLNTGGQYELTSSAPTPTATPPRDSPGPILSIPSNVPAVAGQAVSVPVNFTSNGHSIASTAFSVDYDQTCLAFDPTDNDGDDIPDAVNLSLPGAFNASVTFDGNDTDSELDFLIADTFPPLSSLPDGAIATITFIATCQPSPGTSIIAPVDFSDDPPASFGNTDGQSVPGITSNGSVKIQSGTAGDCNGDLAVDAGDISALTLEIFDGDGNNPADTPGGTFPGDPVGCNANEDAVVDAGDITCTALLIFNAPGACGGSLECITPPSGLAAWWPGDSDANDISGNNNHAQLRNGAQAGEPGKVAGAFKFDGVDDVADTAMALPSKGTLELWVNPFSLSGDHGIIGTFGKANGDDRLWIKVTGPDGGIGGPNRLRVNLGSCCAADFDTPSPLVRGVWTHLALTFDYVSDSYDLYVDGQAVASSTASREAPTEALSFGGLRSTWGESLFFDGLEDEISLYSRVLTPGEIQAIFNAGSAGKCKVTTHGLTATTGLRVPAASTVLTDGPTLVIPDQVPASPSGSVAVPVEFTSNGHSIASTVFSVDYDETLLTFNPGDSDHDGLPDTITLYLPSAFSASVTLDGNDTDGELDILIADTLPPLASLPDGTITTITLDAVNRPSNATTAAVTFSQDPAASFGNTSGQSVPGTSNGGSVLIRCPDCIRFLPMIMVRAQ